MVAMTTAGKFDGDGIDGSRGSVVSTRGDFKCLGHLTVEIQIRNQWWFW